MVHEPCPRGRRWVGRRHAGHKYEWRETRKTLERSGTDRRRASKLSPSTLLSISLFHPPLYSGARPRFQSFQNDFAPPTQNHHRRDSHRRLPSPDVGDLLTPNGGIPCHSRLRARETGHVSSPPFVRQNP